MKSEELSTPDKYNGNSIIVVNNAIDAEKYILKDREAIKSYSYMELADKSINEAR